MAGIPTYNTRKSKTKFRRPAGAGNFDNMDDFNIVKAVILKQGTVQHTPSLDKDIVNKKYLDDNYYSIVDDKYVLNAGDVMTGTLFLDSIGTGLDVLHTAEIGNHLIVGDNLTVDTNTLFVDSVNKRVGIGTITPDVNLDIESDTLTQLRVFAFSDTPTASARLRLGHARNTAASPTATQVGDELFTIQAGGWDTSLSYRNMIKVEADANWGTAGDTSDNPTRLLFFTAPDGTATDTERMRIDSSGNISMTGDLFFTGDGSGLPYGSMYNDNTATNIVIGTAGTFVRIPSGFTIGQVNAITFQNARELAIIKAGRYKIDWSISVALAAGGANDDVEGAIGISNVKNAQGTSHRIIASPTDIGAMSGTAILDLAINQKVALMMTNNSVAANLTVTHASLSLVMVGGT